MGSLPLKYVGYGPIAIFALASALILSAQTPAPSELTVQHEGNFDAERKQANDLFVAGKRLESLPLYEDLCRQDQTISVFAERHGVGLISKSATMADGPDKKVVFEQGMSEIRRAQSLGDNSSLVQTLLSTGRSMVGSIISGVPLTVGYTHKPAPAAQAKMDEAEVAFQHRDFQTAAKLYRQAAALDPAWYDPPVCAGDAYFRMKDETNAAIWFQKAIDIDPDRDTAYRYWGDASYRSGDVTGAKLKFEQAVVAEPYSKSSWIALHQWATVTGIAIVRPQITPPDFTTPGGKLQVDPSLTTETGDGRASWLVYQNARVAHGARTLTQLIVAGSTDRNGDIHPTGYRHTLAEEVECLSAMLADVQRKLDAGTVTREKLEPSLKNLLALQKDGMLECWILLDAADGGIRHDYPAYREQHRDLLTAYVDRYRLAAISSGIR
jgi:tetratricopeptide (TPR) repeat protein